MTHSHLKKDQSYLWHPFTQHKSQPDPLMIAAAQGAYLYTVDDRKIFDGISSWWVTLHGHSHPQIVKAIKSQVDTLEHVIFAGVTHPQACDLAERLIVGNPLGVNRVFFSDNGSTAVEVALKMAIQFQSLRKKRPSKFLALEGGYHGDTFGAMAVGARSPFTQYFADRLFAVDHVTVPGVHDKQSWQKSLDHLSELLRNPKDYCGFIYEPLVQGAGGMRVQNPEVMDTMLGMVKQAGILLIADEVMTGFYRTGKMYASEWFKTKPDLVCVAKGLTGGAIPLAATMATEEIFSEFLSDDRTKAFFHGHSFSGNPTGCAAALASLELLDQSETRAQIRRIAEHHQDFLAHLQDASSASLLVDCRQAGTIVACEFRSDDKSGYFNHLSTRLTEYFRRSSVLLRPLGNVIYLVPPYCSTLDDLQLAYDAILGFAEEYAHG